MNSGTDDILVSAISLLTSTTVFEYSNKFLVFIYFEAFSLAQVEDCIFAGPNYFFR